MDGCATAQYAYDPSNRRYKKVTGGATTHYIWEGSQVIAEYDGSIGAVTAEYVYFGSRMLAKVASGVTQYFLSDRLSGRMALDTSGNVTGRQDHLPFGEDFGEGGSQEKHHFTGYERDTESGADYAVNRQYSPNVGRFHQTDPYGGSSSPVDPQSWNRYSYSDGDPVNGVDPLGLFSYAPPPPPPPLPVVYEIWIISWGIRFVPLDPPGGSTDQTLTNLTPKESAKAFLKKFPGCETAINKAAEKAGLGTIRQALDRVTFIDAADLSDAELGKSLRQLGFPETGSEDEMTSTLGQHVGLFPDKRWKDVGITNFANHKVYLSSIWYENYSTKPADSITVHEVLHDLFQGDHTAVAQALGLSTEGGDTATSRRITAWLDGGCK